MPWTSICLLSSPSTVVLVGVVTQMESLCSLLLRVVTMVVMSLPDRSPDRPADCPRLDFPVNEMSSTMEVRKFECRKYAEVCRIWLVDTLRSKLPPAQLGYLDLG